MKVELAFSVLVDTETDDFDEAIAEARIKADAIIIQTLQATGYRLKYIPSALSLQPEITEQWKKTIDFN
jgi:hypothetical protein